jgi:hypothetical protein
VYQAVEWWDNTSQPTLSEVQEFWGALEEAKYVLREARERRHTGEEGEFREEVVDLRWWVGERSWDGGETEGEVGDGKGCGVWDGFGMRWDVVEFFGRRLEEVDVENCIVVG